jgi:hypothetical protein
MSSVGTNRSLRALAGIGALAILVSAGVFAGREGFAGTRALILVVGGSLAVLVLGFPLGDLVTALRQGVSPLSPPGEVGRSARVWRAAARNAWVLGAIAATAAFVAHMGSFEGLEDFALGLGDVAISALCGLGLAALFGLPALRLTPKRGEMDLAPSASSPREPEAPFTWERLPAYGLLAVLVNWPLLFVKPGSHFPPVDWLLHWPAILAVAGGGLALALYLGFPRNGEALTLGLSSAGIFATLFGLSQALGGFANGSIELVTAGFIFLISSCFASLVGLAAFGLPMQDRAQGLHGDAPSVASRVAAYGIPLVTLVCLALTAVLVMTPMKRKGPSPEDQGKTTEDKVSCVEESEDGGRPPGT